MSALSKKLFDVRKTLASFVSLQFQLNFSKNYTQDGNPLGHIQDISEISMDDLTPQDDRISLGRNRFVTINHFMNRPLVDVREYYEKDGVLRPGLKGLSLRRAEWKKLKENADLIDEKLESLMKQKGGF